MTLSRPPLHRAIAFYPLVSLTIEDLALQTCSGKKRKERKRNGKEKGKGTERKKEGKGREEIGRAHV